MKMHHAHPLLCMLHGVDVEGIQRKLLQCNKRRKRMIRYRFFQLLLIFLRQRKSIAGMIYLILCMVIVAHANAATPNVATSSSAWGSAFPYPEQGHRGRSLLSISFDDGQIKLRDKPSGAPTINKPSSIPSFSQIPGLPSTSPAATSLNSSLPSRGPSLSNQQQHFLSYAPTNLSYSVPQGVFSEIPSIAPTHPTPTAIPVPPPAILSNESSRFPSMMPSDAPSSTFVRSVSPSGVRSVETNVPSLSELSGKGYPSIIPSFVFPVPLQLSSITPSSILSGAPSNVPASPPTRLSSSNNPSISTNHAPSTTYADPSNAPSSIVPVDIFSEGPSDHLPVVLSTNPTSISTNSETMLASDENPSISPSAVLKNNVPSPTSMLSTAPGTLSINPSNIPSIATTKDDTTAQPSLSAKNESVHPSINQSVVVPTNNTPLLPQMDFPSIGPTEDFSGKPISSPTSSPSISQSNSPTSILASTSSELPTVFPSLELSAHPSRLPTRETSERPSLSPTTVPSLDASSDPSSPLSSFPIESFAETQSLSPSNHPTYLPSTYSSEGPSVSVFALPNSSSSDIPSVQLSLEPTEVSLILPSLILTKNPSVIKSVRPSILPPSGLLPSMSPTRSILQFSPNHINSNKAYRKEESSAIPWIEYLLITVFGLVLGVVFGAIVTRRYRQRNKGNDNKGKTGEISKGFELEVDSIFDDGSTIVGSREMLPTTFKKNARQRVTHQTNTTSISGEDEEEEECSTPHRNKLHLMTELDELDALNGAIHEELCHADSLFDGLSAVFLSPKNDENGWYEKDADEESCGSLELLSSEGSNVWEQVFSSSHSYVWSQITSSSYSLSMTGYNEQNMDEFTPWSSARNPNNQINDPLKSQLAEAGDKTKSPINQVGNGPKEEYSPLFLDSSLV